MKSVKLIVPGAFLALTFAAVTLFNKTSAQTPHPASVKNDGFAVLELFTSEGCSSCPPAEAVLANIEQQAAGKPIYVLAYHVDYWNRLGWKDSFSDAKFTARQYQYNKQFTSEVYTPQLIINGKAEYIGSDAPAIESSINSALNSKAATSLNLHAQLRNDSASIEYNLPGTVSDEQLEIAVVQRQATSSVRAGENAGKTLLHVQIVRDLQTVKLKGKSTGSITITLPKQFNVKDWELIAFLQNKQSGAIEAAGRVAVGN